MGEFVRVFLVAERMGSLLPSHLTSLNNSGDPLQATSIKFPTKESAVSFAEQQGYDYWIDEPKEPKFRVKQYASNYKYTPGKLRICHTK